MVSAERRSFHRISANIDARFFYGNIFYSGVVINLSERGMFLATKRCLPNDSMFVVIIRENQDLLKVIAKVRRVSVEQNSCHGMGIELLSPSDGYLNFINRLRVNM